MSSLILCHKKKAKVPYEIVRIHRNIYTIEELCYYLCNHVYLVDHTLMNEKLCDWLEQELELVDLAEELRRMPELGSQTEAFIITVLAHASMHTTTELKQIQAVLEKLKNQKPIEKQKYKADNLLLSGAVQASIMIYRDILNGERDEEIDGKFYGKVYANLGTAYGRLFLYEEAAKMYEAAFQICEELSMLKAYLYACRRYMSGEEYMRLIQRSPLYQKTEEVLQKEIEKVAESVQMLQYEDTLMSWKNQYRRISTGEI